MYLRLHLKNLLMIPKINKKIKILKNYVLNL
jgi:hypothetical protein